MSRTARILVVSLAIAGVVVLVIASMAFAAGPQSRQRATQDCLGLQVGCNAGQCGLVYDEGVTSLLGLTSEQILEQRNAGKSLAQIGSEQGIDQEALINALIANRQAFLQERVQTGILTDEEAERRIEIIREKITAAINNVNACDGTGTAYRAADETRRGTRAQGSVGNEASSPTGTGMMQRFGRDRS